MSITSSGVIIIPEKGFVPPKAYLELCYKNFPDFGSSCYRLADAGNEPEFLISGDKKLLSIDDMLKALEALKDEPGIVYFAKINGDLSKESEQPFEIIKDEANKPVGVAFIDGEYPQHSNKDSVDTDEANVADLIGMSLRKVYTKLCVSDITTFETELRDEDTKKYINSLCVNRGVVAIMTLKGNIFRFESGNTLGLKYPWGYVSNRLGFEGYQEIKEPTAEPKVEEPKGRGSMLDRIRNKITGPAVVIADTKPLDTKKIEPKADTGVKAPDHMIKPPDDLKKKKEWKKIKQWYDNWTEPHGLTKDNMMEGKAAPANERWIGQNIGKFVKATDGLEQLKDRIEASAGEPGKNIPKAPIITPRMRHVVAALLESDHAKAITEGGKVLDPKELKEGPKIAPFSAQQGYPIDKVFCWDDRLYEDFLKKCHVENDWTPAILLFRELRDDLMALMIDEPKHDKDGNIVIPPAEPKIITEKVVDQPAQTPKQSLLAQIKARNDAKAKAA